MAPLRSGTFSATPCQGYFISLESAMNLIAAKCKQAACHLNGQRYTSMYDETRGKEALERAKTNIGLMIVGKEGRKMLRREIRSLARARSSVAR